MASSPLLLIWQPAIYHQVVTFNQCFYISLKSGNFRPTHDTIVIKRKAVLVGEEFSWIRGGAHCICIEGERERENNMPQGLSETHETRLFSH